MHGLIYGSCRSFDRICLSLPPLHLTTTNPPTPFCFLNNPPCTARRSATATWAWTSSTGPSSTPVSAPAFFLRQHSARPRLALIIACVIASRQSLPFSSTARPAFSTSLVNTNQPTHPPTHLHIRTRTGEKLGIFWDVRDDAKGRVSRKSKRL
jgi:hypothetical protein